MTNLVRTFQVMPEQTVRMGIELQGGMAILHFDGDADIPCWCGQLHSYMVRADVRVTHEFQDLNDLEAAIRGNEAAAQRVGWKIITSTILLGKKSPCES